MINPTLSVIVTTSPGRELHLSHCLSMLQRQTLPEFDVIVVDDGSMHASQICEGFQNTLTLNYLGRENDGCISRSRNQGLAVARGEMLVIIDSDILLNPAALQAYQNCLSAIGPQTFLYGYCGYYYELLAPSLWFPDQVVNWSDYRFPCALDQQRLKANGKIFTEAARYAWGGNSAGYRSSYEQLGGFNEAFKGWGREDEEIAWRMILADFRIGFILDGWAEHLHHPKREPFHQQYLLAEKAKKDQHLNHLIAQCPPHEAILYASPHVNQTICEHIRQHYWVKGWEIESDPAFASMGSG